MLLNVNPILQLFPTCLVHLTVYELLAVLPKHRLALNCPDIHPFQNPIVLSRLFVKGSVSMEDHWLNQGNNFEYQLSESSAITFVFPPGIVHHTCSAQLYYNYDKIQTFYETLPASYDSISCGSCHFLPDYFKDLLFPRVRCKQDEEDMCPYTLAPVKAEHHSEFNKAHTLEKFHVYQILLSDDNRRSLTGRGL